MWAELSFRPLWLGEFWGQLREDSSLLLLLQPEAALLEAVAGALRGWGWGSPPGLSRSMLKTQPLPLLPTYPHPE